MKAILSGTTLKISTETEQESKDLKIWLERNVGREGDMEFDTSSANDLNCGNCNFMVTERIKLYPHEDSDVDYKEYKSCSNKSYPDKEDKTIFNTDIMLPFCPFEEADCSSVVDLVDGYSINKICGNCNYMEITTINGPYCNHPSYIEPLSRWIADADKRLEKCPL